MTEPDADLVALPAYLREPPRGFADQPVAGERLLPFDRLSAADFERLCLAAAERVDGLEDARLYGNPGQRQHGIDLFGRTVEGYSDYQVRRVEAELTPTALRYAIEDFAGGLRPFGARRFILCYAMVVRRTQTLEELATLRLELPDLSLDLWDGERLTRILRQAPNVVELYFNENWRTVLYGPPPAPGGPATAPLPPLTVEALARGPMRVLGLEAELSAAEAATDPLDRAARLDEIAERLSLHGFEGVASAITRQRVEGLLDTGYEGQAVGLLLAETEQLTERGGVSPRPPGLHRLRDLRQDLEPLATARLQALEAMHGFYVHAPSALDQFAGCAAHLIDLPGAQANAALTVTWWAEAALACRDDEHLRRATDFAARLQERSPSELQTRLRIVIAESSGNWDVLLRDVAMGALMTVDQGLVYCRHARWLAWQGDGDAARRSYRAAIDPLARANYMRDLTYSIRSEHDVSALLSWNPSQADHILSQVTGVGSRLPADRNAYSNALEDLSKEQWPGAHMWANRCLFESVRLGNLRSELLTRQLLARIYSQTDEPIAAAANHILCGHGQDAAAVIARGSAPMDVAELMAERAPWVRGALLSVVAADADLRTPEDSAALLPELRLGLSAPQVAFIGPSLPVEAFKALAAMVLVLPEGEISVLLEALEEAIPRPPGQPLMTDRACAQAMSLMEEYRPALRAEVRRLMLTALDHDALAQDLETALATAARDDDAFREALVARSRQNNLFATRALLIAEVETPETRALADRWVVQALAAPAPTPSHIGFGGQWGLIGAAAHLLPEDRREEVARHLMAVAENPAYLELDRAGAVRAAGYLGMDVSAALRSSLFARAIGLAGGAPLNPFDDLARQSTHKLSSFRIRLGQGELVRRAVVASVRLATSAGEVASASAHVADLLSSSAEEDAGAAASALVALPEAARGEIPLQTLAESPLEEVRGAAAYFFCQAGEPSEVGRILAADRSRHVRLTMATNLASLPDTTRDLREIEKVLLGDASAVVRAAARLNCRSTQTAPFAQ